MKIFLDDIRKAPPGYILIKNVDVLINLYNSYGNDIKEISLDHDLGDGYKTGYDFCKWFEEKVFNNEITYIPKFTLHTANPVGRKNMAVCLYGIKKYIDQKE